MEDLVIIEKEGVKISEINEGEYRLSHTSAFAAATPKNGEQDARVETLCDVASALFHEISRLEQLKKVYGIVNDIYDFGLPNVIPVLVVNAVMHGNKYDHSKSVSVLYTHEEPNADSKKGKFTFTVSDQGPGFDYRALRRAARDARSTSRTFNNYRSSSQIPDNSLGRGLFELLEYATGVRWNKTGNEVKVTKCMKSLSG